MSKVLAAGTEDTTLCAQNGVVAEGGDPQLDAQLFQLVADFRCALLAAFADNNTGGFGSKKAAERQSNLATALDSDQLALNSLSEPFGGSLRRVLGRWGARTSTDETMCAVVWYEEEEAAAPEWRRRCRGQ
jgi:hypothetical protein